MTRFKYAFVLAVGPEDRATALDTLDSLRYYHPNADIFIMDDCTTNGTYEALRTWASEGNAYLYRNPYPFGFRGLSRSLGTLFMHIVTLGKDYSFVFKIDTDTLFTQPGIEQVVSRLFKEHGPGIVGDYKYDCYGKRREIRAHVKKMFRDLFPIGIHPGTRSLRIGFPFFTPYLFRAIVNHYRIGESAFGGMYAIHGLTLQKWYNSNFLQRLLKTENLPLTREEDLLFSLATKAVGHSLIELSQPGSKQYTWLEHGKTISITAEEIHQLNYAVIHPLKGDENSLSVRQYFKAIRDSNKRPVSSKVIPVWS